MTTEAERVHANLRAALVAATEAMGRAVDAINEADQALCGAWAWWDEWADRAEPMNTEGK